MNAYVVVVGESFAQSVDRVQRQSGGVQRVYAVLRTSARVRSHAVIGEAFLNIAVTAGVYVEKILHAGTRMEHERHVRAVEIAAVEEFVLAAVVADSARFPQFLAEVRLNFFFGGYGAQPYRAAHGIGYAPFFERERNADHSRALSVMPARVRVAVDRREVVGNVQSVQFAQYEYFRTGLARVDVGVKTGNIACFNKRIARFLENIFEISRGLPLPIARFRVRPDVALGGEYFVTVLVYGCVYEFRVHFLPLVSLF